MWVSHKKRLLREALGENLWLGCFDCFSDLAMSYPEILAKHLRVDV